MFLKVGDKMQAHPRAMLNLITTAIGLVKQLKFPHSTKQLIILELTVTCKERMEFVKTCRERSWQTNREVLEEEFRGFAGQLFYLLLAMFGIISNAKRKVI